MKDSMSELMNEIKEKIGSWNNIKSGKKKVFLVTIFIVLVSLKVFTTVLTFDWLAGLFK
jgi:hypothetical protein